MAPFDVKICINVSFHVAYMDSYFLWIEWEAVMQVFTLQTSSSLMVNSFLGFYFLNFYCKQWSCLSIHAIKFSIRMLCSFIEIVFQTDSILYTHIPCFNIPSLNACSLSLSLLSLISLVLVRVYFYSTLSIQLLFPLYVCECVCKGARVYCTHFLYLEDSRYFEGCQETGA